MKCVRGLATSLIRGATGLGSPASGRSNIERLGGRLLSNLRSIDRLLLGIVVPVWLAVFALHVRAAIRTGLAQTRVFVTMPDRDGYPHVGGFRPEYCCDAGGLNIGDRLLRAGETDLRGVGHIAFDAIVIEEGRASGKVAMEFERNGLRQTATLPLEPLPVPWMRIPMLLALAGTAIVVLLRAGGSTPSRFLFGAFLGLAMLQSPFHGGSYLETYASKLIFYAGNLIVPPLFFSWLLHFPPELKRPSRRALWLPWAFLPLGALARGSYALGGPIPQGVAPHFVQAVDGLVVAVGLAFLTSSYRRVDPLGRRRIKWVLLGAYVAGIPVVATLLAGAFDPQGPWFREALFLPAVGVCAMPIGVLIAIVRHNLFDIDRLISVTATYSALGIFLAAGTLTVVPLIAGAISATLSVDLQISQLLTSLALAVSVPPAHKRLYPAIDNALFPERRALQEGMQRLHAELSGCDSPRTLTEQAGTALHLLIRPTTCAIYGRGDDRFSPVFARGAEVAPIAVSDPLIAVLERRMAVVAAEGTSGFRRGAHLSPYERAALEELRVSVVAPVRGRRGLVAFFSLGPKRSGDVYTSSDVAWLSAVADRISSELLRFEDSAPFRPRRAEEVSPLARGSPPTQTATQVTTKRFTLVECPMCGACYSAGVWRCERDDTPVAIRPLPRHFVDRYRLERRLGGGGMGTVYEATDTSLERSVAVKIIREDLAATPDAAERFRKEALATAAFAHPNVVTVHDFGIADEIIPFLVLERLHGRSLRDELRESRRLTPPEALRILTAMCAAVGAAHRRDLVHRDLKPENIFLSRQEGEQIVKVLDFGLAKFWGDDRRRETDTRPGTLVGTLAYMAPERFHGEDVHPAWDLWSLGIMTYEMLAGQRPFTADTSSGVQRAVMAGRFEAIARHIPEAPAGLQGFFERALALDVGRRPASAAGFLDELMRGLS